MNTHNWKQQALHLAATTSLSWRKIAKELGVAKSSCSDYLRECLKAQQPTPDIVEAVENKEQEIARIKTQVKKERKNITHLVIPDTQCKPGISLDYLRWIGEYIAEKQPDVIIHLGDHADMPSLSSYDKGKKSAEGKRVKHDIEAAIEGMNVLLTPIKKVQDETGYTPEMVFLLGNHEERQARHVDANPELEGFLSYDSLRYKEMGWKVYDFLEVATIDGVAYSHYFANPMTGKPYTGTATNMLKTIGTSFTMGHRQVLDTATRFLHNGQQQWGLICGAAYEHEERYKGYQGNFHFRGIIVKHNVSNGSYEPMFVSLDYLKNKFN